MNVKTARALRKIVGLKPNSPRKYESLVVRSAGRPTKKIEGTQVNSPDSARGRYRAAKKLYVS